MITLSICPVRIDEAYLLVSPEDSRIDNDDMPTQPSTEETVTETTQLLQQQRKKTKQAFSRESLIFRKESRRHRYNII